MDTKTISTEELKSLMDRDEGVPVVNVLEREQFEKAHIPGSKHVGLHSKDFLERMNDLVDGDKSRKIVVYCASKSCDASPKAARKLADAGFENVVDYEGGMQAWRDAGMAVESGAPVR